MKSKPRQLATKQTNKYLKSIKIMSTYPKKRLKDAWPRQKELLKKMLSFCHKMLMRNRSRLAKLNSKVKLSLRNLQP